MGLLGARSLYIGYINPITVASRSEKAGYHFVEKALSGALEQLFCGRASVAATGRNWCCTVTM